MFFTILVGVNIAFDFILALPKLVPGERGLTAILVLSVLLYWAMETGFLSLGPGLEDRLKWSLCALAVVLLVILPAVLAIAFRQRSGAAYFAHDGLIQTEAATDYLLQGKNPYVEDYLGTAMADWPYREGDLTTNPTLFNYLYLPVTFLLPVPFVLLLKPLLGWFDFRLIYLLAFVGLLALSVRLVSGHVRRELFLLLSLNPLLVPFLVEGRNDVLSLFLLVAAIFLLKNGRFALSGIVLGVACSTKQYAWLFVPFYLLILFVHARRLTSGARGHRRALIAWLVTCMVGLGPWLIWNAPAFVGDIFSFQAQNSAWSFPVAGFGLGSLLLDLGLLSSNLDAFPFWVLQASIGGPLLYVLLRRVAREPSPRNLVLAATFFTSVLLFLARAFNDNYLSFVSSMFFIGAYMEPSSIGGAAEGNQPLQDRHA